MRRVRWCAAALWLVLLASPPALAEDVSLVEARRRAGLASPDAQRAARKLPIATAEVQVAAAWPNPSVSLHTAQETARFGSTLTVPLPVFGRRGSAIAAAEADVMTAARDAALAQQEVRLGVTMAWIELWDEQEHDLLFRSAYEYAERLHDIARQRVAAGLGEEIDVRRSAADSARVKAAQVSSAGKTRSAAIRLQLWIGSSELPSASPDTTFPRLPPKPELLRTLDSHPLVARDAARVAALAASVERDETLRWPELDAQFTALIHDPTIPGNDFAIGASFELPVFSRRAGEIARQIALMHEAELAATLDRQQLESELSAAYEEAAAADASLAVLREQVLPLIKETMVMTEDGYRAGKLDLARLLDAERALRESFVAELDARTEYARALAALEHTSGAALFETAAETP